MKAGFVGFGEINTPAEIIVRKCAAAEAALKKEGISLVSVYTFVVVSFCVNLTSYFVSFSTNPSSVLTSCSSYVPIGNFSIFKLPFLSTL